MSRAYRIAVAESLKRHIQVEDGVRSSLELLPILSKDRMAELLAAELEQEGFARKDGTAIRREPDGVEVVVDLGSGEVTARVSATEEVSLERKRSALVASESEKAAGEERLREELRRTLEREAEGLRETLRQDVTAKLEGKLRELSRVLDGVVNRVTARALKARAAELGTIEEITEDAATGSMTIKVRL